MFFAAVDIGASFVKSAILNLDTLELLQVRRTSTVDFEATPDADVREISPLRIAQRVEEHLAEKLKECPACEGIVFAGQMHGLCLVGLDGRPLSNIISWQDKRSLRAHPSGRGTYFDVLRARLTDQQLRGLGNELRPGLPVTNLFWLAESGHLPADAIPMSIPDFVVAHLCRRRGVLRARTHPTHAAATGAFCLESGAWDDAVVEAAGLRSLRWPELADLRDPVGFFDCEGRGIPCFVPVGDHQAALAGVALERDELSANVGTGCQISRLVHGFDPGNSQLRPYFDGVRLATITHIPAGRALNALVRLLAELGTRTQGPVVDPWPAIIAAVAAIETTDLSVDLSFFPSVSGSRGSISGVTEENLNVGNLFLAAIQDIARKLHSFSARLPQTGPVVRIVLSGGLTRRLDRLVREIEACFAVPTRLSPAEEETLAGLLCLSLWLTGKATSVRDAGLQFRARREQDMPAAASRHSS